METKLLPCPFCGGEAEKHSWRDVVKETREVPPFRNDEGCICHTQEFVIAKATIGEVYCSSCGATIRRFGDINADMPTIRQKAVDAWNTRHIDGETSDGYHTFNELYHHRALLFSVIVRNYPGMCWKSKKHHTGDMYEGMFIVGINTPDGQASYHYDVDPYWDMFDCEELEFAPEWDGHTPAQAIERIGKLTRFEQTCRLIAIDGGYEEPVYAWACDQCGNDEIDPSCIRCWKCNAKVVGHD